MSSYSDRIKCRSTLHFFIGLFPRLKKFIKSYCIVALARRKGAEIGQNVTIPYKLAKKANTNLKIGNNTTIQSYKIDLRSPVSIGNNVIIGAGVEILTASHNIDSEEWEYKAYGIEIGDFCWLATKVFVLPACRNIGRGAVCSAGSVLVSNVDSMSVVGGNPAKHIKYRKVVHSKLIVESLLGNDLKEYFNTYLELK